MPAPDAEPSVAVLARATGMSHRAFAERVREVLWPALDRPRELAVTPAPPPRLGVVPLARTPFALALAAAPPPPLEGLVVHAYRVRTSAPIEGDPHGPGMVTLFRRRPGIDPATFLRRWHEGHSPLAVRVHPLTRYVRCVVEAPLGEAPPLDGIVLEQTRTRADLVHPWRFFGGPWRMIPNAVRIALDVRGFLDLRTIENQLVEVSVPTI